MCASLCTCIQHFEYFLCLLVRKGFQEKTTSQCGIISYHDKNIGCFTCIRNIHSRFIWLLIYNFVVNYVCYTTYYVLRLIIFFHNGWWSWILALTVINMLVVKHKWLATFNYVLVYRYIYPNFAMFFKSVS